MKLLIILTLSLLINCQSTPDATTARIQERSEHVTTNLDNAANDCLSENCKRAMREAKELINDSLDIMTDKDTDIIALQKQIQKDKFYSDLGKIGFWLFIIFVIGTLLYIFRNQIFAIIKIII